MFNNPNMFICIHNDVFVIFYCGYEDITYFYREYELSVLYDEKKTYILRHSRYNPNSHHDKCQFTNILDVLSAAGLPNDSESLLYLKEIFSIEEVLPITPDNISNFINKILKLKAFL